MNGGLFINLASKAKSCFETGLPEILSVFHLTKISLGSTFFQPSLFTQVVTLHHKQASKRTYHKECFPYTRKKITFTKSGKFEMLYVRLHLS